MLLGCVCPKICRINYLLKYSKTFNVTVCFIFKALPSSDCLKLFPALENCLLGSKYFAGQHLYPQIKGKHQPKYIHSIKKIFLNSNSKTVILLVHLIC